MSTNLFTEPLSRRGLLKAGAASAVLAGLTGCSSNSASPSGPKTLNVAVFTDQASANKLTKAAGTFEAAHPGVKVKFTGTTGTDWNDFFSKLLTQIAAGNAPDIAAVATEGLQLFAAKELAEPLDDYVKRDASELKSYFADVHPALVEAMMYQGHLYELPSDFNAGNMFYSTSLLSSVGVERPADNWTKDDFYDIARKVSAKGNNVVGWNWVVRLWGSWTSWMYANGGNLLTEGKYDGGDWLWNTFYPNDPAAAGRKGGWQWGDPTANSTPVVEALDFMIQLQKEGLSPTPDVGGGGTLQGLFASNKIGMAIGGGFWAGGLHNAGMAPGSFDVQYFPKWKSQRHLFGAGGYGILKSSKNKDLAWEFLKTLVTPKNMDLLSPGNVTTFPRKSMMTAQRYASTGPKNWQVFYDTLTKFDDTAPIPAPPYYNAMAIALNKRTTQAMSTGDAKSALDGLQSDLESAAKTS
ncbi:ABC-type glycerol-3-phosphate transport system substrate-binding protein [Kribbella antiqua]|uniref:ABC-type glycerol-3-phosphate transport system substrate-binding protein n=1 Tax=Kribbella antiqua TaxID=2512217 RepID=A0A4R2IZ91_9ACTN|nr:extracellular solute-binding protein [Kribbella antiqua]TCO51281.1 ABC-type glycerol-3-phosphate transport system substrate-binding protein [Kribbella antiqua]